MRFDPLGTPSGFDAMDGLSVERLMTAQLGAAAGLFGVGLVIWESSLEAAWVSISFFMAAGLLTLIAGFTVPRRYRGRMEKDLAEGRKSLDGAPPTDD